MHFYISLINFSHLLKLTMEQRYGYLPQSWRCKLNCFPRVNMNIFYSYLQLYRAFPRIFPQVFHSFLPSTRLLTNLNIVLLYSFYILLHELLWGSRDFYKQWNSNSSSRQLLHSFHNFHGGFYLSFTTTFTHLLHGFYLLLLYLL